MDKTVSNTNSAREDILESFHSYSSDEWRVMPDSDFVPAIIEMAKEARSLPSSDWEDVRQRMYAKHGGSVR
jgi:hypothetical protein